MTSSASVERPARPLTGRTALVTGGGRGVGAAVSRALASRGADLLITYRSDHGTAARVAESCRDEHGTSARALAFDMTSPDGPDALLDSVRAEGAVIDVLVVNAAAAFVQQPLSELASSTLTEKIGHDVGGLHRLATAIVPGMVQRGFGRVVVVGSLHAQGPTAPGMTANGVSKAALAAYVDFAVDELTGPGVTINTVHPGHVTTDAGAHVPAAVTDRMRDLTPSARLGRPEDVAAVVAMLCGPDAEFVNGARVPVAGGLNHPASLRRLLHAPGAS